MKQEVIESIVKFAAQNYASRKILVSTDIVKEETQYNAFTLIPVEALNEGTFILPGKFKKAIYVSGIEKFNDVFDPYTTVHPIPDEATEITILNKKYKSEYPHFKTVSIK